MRVGDRIVPIATHRDAVVVVEAFIIEKPHPTCAVRLTAHTTDGFRELKFAALVSFVDKQRAKDQEHDAYTGSGRPRYYCSALGSADAGACC